MDVIELFKQAAVAMQSDMRYLALMQMGKNYTKYALTPIQAFQIATEGGAAGAGR